MKKYTVLTPEQLEQQAQVVGKWEQTKHIPDVKRLTWWYPDFGVFVKNELVSDVELSGRYEKVIESKARSARKIPIAERLKEGADQAAKDNAAWSAPVKSTEKDR